MPTGGVVVAIDAGTTGVRAFAVDETGAPVDYTYREFPQHFPKPGWVEHDANEIWAALRTPLPDLKERLGAARSVPAMGIPDQRETTVVWEKKPGEPRHRAIVWQDRRTAARCEALQAEGHLPF